MKEEALESVAALMTSGTPEEIADLLVSMTGDVGAGSDMWKRRAHALALTLATALCDLRDQGKITLTPQLIREHLHLGGGISREAVPSDTDRAERWAIVLSEKESQSIDAKTGLLPLYLRALKGEMSEATIRSMTAFFDTLPGFSLEKAVAGEPQGLRTIEQFGYMSMMISKPLFTLIDESDI
jgi:hypothetical protein